MTVHCTFTQLDKRQRMKKAERSEASLEVSEYHLVKSGVTDKDTIHVKDLIKSLERKGDQSNLTKKLRYIQQKNKVLSKPLEKPAAERIKRTVGYDKVKKELEKWDSVVTRNRTAQQLSFPLKHLAPIKDSRTSKIPEFLRGFSTKSDLMKKFEELDPALLYPADKEEEKGNKYKMTLEEVILRRKEAARLRAQQSYKEAKAHRQRKIKSKKFHRIQRKDKIKQQLKDFEKLKDSNPEEALVKLAQLDKTRAEERMSLRHKNTGQWARNKQIKAKYNKETRQILTEQLAISKELTQKVRRTDSDESEDDEENVEDVEDKEYEEDKEDETSVNDNESNIKTESEIENFIKLCRKFYDKKQQTKGEKTEKDETSDEIMSEKEKETCHTENSSTLRVSINMKNNVCNDEENSILQANTKSDTKSKSHGNEKNSSLRGNKRNTKSKLYGNETSGTSNASTSDAKNEFSSNEKSSTSLEKTNDIKDRNHKKEKNKENCKNNKKSKSQDKNKATNSKELKEAPSKRKLNLTKQEVKKKLKTNHKTANEEKENEDYSPSLEFEDPKRKPILDSPLEETTSTENIHEESNLKKINLKKIANMVQEPVGSSNEIEIDPKKYVNIKPKHLKTQLPDVATAGDDDSEQEEETFRIMSEAFADDNVVEEFRKENEEEMKKSQPQNIDLSLPGWGSWGGPNIKKSKATRKKSRFILNVPKQMPRKSENQGDVIVFEHENEKLKKHLVKELPYPFTRVKDFEATIRAPISRTFVPMNAHVRLIQPVVKTKLGQVIEPMDENELVKEQPMVKKPLKRIKTKNDKKKNTVKNNNKKRITTKQDKI
ncbi:PREDICTED: U3 small nucleolar RNA-associated protein 14 homolog A [Trachymyrmex cornetzi]|uniref:U3 small nucleolar RNA-associated protein 14 like protein A n=1 Tax=Trachymyrmex cornetzi TaxID=471704 RepID=A0A151IR27_9HYME|nr:PREDICTED: U3 small nucleolar RNA-associated protein 14 homolog A [Trachymyrmex cornetzi]KYN09105.1 U3 small nucleolar RNA-associated protein 14 like protein A [Trachymyrmex cornetzi]